MFDKKFDQKKKKIFLSNLYRFIYQKMCRIKVLLIRIFEYFAYYFVKIFCKNSFRFTKVALWEKCQTNQ